jgi:hypothetical protein
VRLAIDSQARDQVKHEVRSLPGQLQNPTAKYLTEIPFDNRWFMFETRIDLPTVAPGRSPSRFTLL